MIISLVWLIFYYIQRFRYMQAKDQQSVSVSHLIKFDFNCENVAYSIAQPLLRYEKSHHEDTNENGQDDG